MKAKIQAALKKSQVAASEWQTVKWRSVIDTLKRKFKETSFPLLGEAGQLGQIGQDRKKREPDGSRKTIPKTRRERKRELIIYRIH